MGLEVEMKFRDVDHDSLRRSLATVGAIRSGIVDQSDVYLSHPCRDFRESGEALRVRTTGDSSRITYKGPRQPGLVKTREEIELPVGSGLDDLSALLRMWQLLGFQPVATVRKTRELFHLDVDGLPFEVGLDTVDGLGPFAEVEILAPDDSLLPALQSSVQSLSSSLGLVFPEPRSYLRMILEALPSGT